MTIKEASLKTGYAIGTIRNLYSQNKIQGLKDGRFVFVCVDDLFDRLGRKRGMKNEVIR
jgi:hypothetical protein